MHNRLHIVLERQTVYEHNVFRTFSFQLCWSLYIIIDVLLSISITGNLRQVHQGCWRKLMSGDDITFGAPTLVQTWYPVRWWKSQELLCCVRAVTQKFSKMALSRRSMKWSVATAVSLYVTAVTSRQYLSTANTVFLNTFILGIFQVRHVQFHSNGSLMFQLFQTDTFEKQLFNIFY